MKKFNLSEAAQAVLVGEGSKETFDSNIASKRSGQNGPSKLSTSVVAGQKDIGKIGDSPNSTKDGLPDYTKGVPSATPPGATPPVGSEPMHKLAHQPQEDKNGDEPDVQGSEDSYETIRDRKPGTKPKQMMVANKGSTGVQTKVTQAK